MTPTTDIAPAWLLASPPDTRPTWRQSLTERGHDLLVAIGLVTAIVMTNLLVDVLHANLQRGEQLRTDQVAAARAPATAVVPLADDDLRLAVAAAGAGPTR